MGTRLERETRKGEHDVTKDEGEHTDFNSQETEGRREIRGSKKGQVENNGRRGGKLSKYKTTHLKPKTKTILL